MAQMRLKKARLRLMMKKWKIKIKRMMLEFLTKLKRRKKKEIFD